MSQEIRRSLEDHLDVLKIVEVVKDTNFLYMDIIFQKGVITHRALGPTKKSITHLLGIICNKLHLYDLKTVEEV